MPVTLAKIDTMPIGTVLKKGKRKRIYRGLDGMFVFYSTPSKPQKVSGVLLSDFRKWLLDADIVSS